MKGNITMQNGKNRNELPYKYQKSIKVVSICPSLYRCTNCGADLEQKVNGVIQYIPASTPGSKIPILQVIEDGPE